MDVKLKTYMYLLSGRLYQAPSIWSIDEDIHMVEDLHRSFPDSNIESVCLEDEAQRAEDIMLLADELEPVGPDEWDLAIAIATEQTMAEIIDMVWGES